MNCSDMNDLIRSWDEIDGPPVALSADVRRHLDACASCNEMYGRLAQERDAYAAYAAELVPAADLWNKIEASIGKQRPPVTLWAGVAAFISRRLTAPVFATAVVTVAALVVGYLWSLSDRADGGGTGNNVSTIIEPYVNPSVDPRPIAEVTPAGPVPMTSGENSSVSPPRVLRPPRQAHSIKREGTVPGPESVERLVRDIERKYDAAIASLTRDIRRQQGSLSSAAVSMIGTSMPAIDSRIDMSRRAVREQGYDPLAIQSLNDAYGRKIELLRNVVGK
jgi:hypothetical protein